MRAVVLAWALLLPALGASAKDRAVTDEERARLTDAVKAESCSGGKMKVEDGKFEVEAATCANGKKWDLKFDAQFKLIEKERED